MREERDMADGLRGRLPRTEDSHERGYVEDLNEADDPVTYDDLGKKEELVEDDEQAGDIADEGAGHRG
jgi:hypothetical protein